MAPIMSRSLFITLIVVLIGLAMIPMLESRYLIDIATEILIYILFATSLNILIGYSGNVSFGHAAYFAIGGYANAIFLTTYEWPFILAMPAAILLSMVCSGVVAWFCTRLTDIYFAMLTLAFSMFIWAIAFKWRSVTGGDDGFVGVNVPAIIEGRVPFFYFTLIVVSVCMGILWLICHSAFGKTLIAVRENMTRAGFVGINNPFDSLDSICGSGNVCWRRWRHLRSVQPGVLHRIRLLDGIGASADYDATRRHLFIFWPRRWRHHPIRAGASHQRVHGVLAVRPRLDSHRDLVVPPGGHRGFGQQSATRVA